MCIYSIFRGVMKILNSIELHDVCPGITREQCSWYRKKKRKIYILVGSKKNSFRLLDVWNMRNISWCYIRTEIVETTVLYFLLSTILKYLLHRYAKPIPKLYTKQSLLEECMPVHSRSSKNWIRRKKFFATPREVL